MLDWAESNILLRMAVSLYQARASLVALLSLGNPQNLPVINIISNRPALWLHLIWDQYKTHPAGWFWRGDFPVTYCYSDWDSNCLGCECKWSSGKKVANCTNAKLNSIPQNLHAEVQVLILDYNFISSLGENIFIRNLPNLQKISLRHCGIKTINEKAFNGLKILVEVDLSFNNITKECRFKTEIF